MSGEESNHSRNLHLGACRAPSSIPPRAPARFVDAARSAAPAVAVPQSCTGPGAPQPPSRDSFHVQSTRGASSIDLHILAKNKSLLSIDQGEFFPLTKSQSMILRLLVEQTRRLNLSRGWVSNEVMLDALAARFGKSADRHQLSAVIYGLRNRIERAGASRALLIRQRGKGARFVLLPGAIVHIVDMQRVA